MNLIYGQCGAGKAADALGSAEQFIQKSYNAAPKLFSFKVMDAVCGELRTDGYMSGRAVDGDLMLLFSGFFWKPLPGWHEGTPLDQPDKTAAYLLSRYRQLGDKFLNGLPGHYGLGIFDGESKEMRIAADPYGQRTLYVGNTASGPAFSSKLAVLCRLMTQNLRIDRCWEDFFLIYGFYPHGCTPFEGITALSPGQMMTWKNGSVTMSTISQMKTTQHKATELVNSHSVDTNVELLYDGFMHALEEHSTDQSDVGVLLGGFDSALVAAGLKRLGKNVSTWTFHYDADQYNQPHIKDLAVFLDIKPEYVHITEQTVREGIERFALLFNQPTNWPNYVIQTAVVCNKMREAGLSFAYSGDGCDTVFLGYPGTWRRARLLQSLPNISERLGDALVGLLARPVLDRLIGHPYRVILNLFRSATWSQHARGYLSFRIFDELSLAQLREDITPMQQLCIRDIVESLAKPLAGLPPLRLAYLGKAGVSPNRNKMSGSSDLSGMPILSPYLHPEFKALAQSLPEELCRPTENTSSKITGKYILMLMAEKKGLLPPAVIYQNKMAAVDAPVDDWYADSLKQFMLEKMDTLPFSANRNYLKSLLEPHITEQLFKKYFMTDKVIKHAPSLLATYARFCALAKTGEDWPTYTVNSAGN